MLILVQGEDVRKHLRDIPRDSDPIPLIHVYVDLHLMTLRKAGFISSGTDSAAREHETVRPCCLTTLLDVGEPYLSS